MTRAVFVGACLMLCPSIVRGAQSAPAPPPPEKPPAAPAAPASPADPASGYVYNPEGRRDPFLSLIGRGVSSSAAGRQVEGLKGLSISDVTVSGIVKSRSGFVAILHGPDSKTYLARPNDQLLDGRVKSITVDTVVFRQDITNPLAIVKEREVRKSLRLQEEVP